MFNSIDENCELCQRTKQGAEVSKLIYFLFSYLISNITDSENFEKMSKDIDFPRKPGIFQKKKGKISLNVENILLNSLNKTCF